MLPLLEPGDEPAAFRLRERLSGTGRGYYEGGVGEIHERIVDGEAFQVVLSGYEEHRFEGDPFQLYLRLRKVNPSPYMFYLDFGERKVLGSSPETLVTVRDVQKGCPYF